MKTPTVLLLALVAAAGVAVYMLTKKAAAPVKPAVQAEAEWWEDPAGEILKEWLT